MSAAPLPTPAGALAPGRPRLRLVPPWASDPAGFGPQPSGRAELPPPRPWAGRVVQAVVEVLVGDRPVQQLAAWTSPQIYEALQARAGVLSGRRGRRPLRPVVRSVRVGEPADGVVEACAVVRFGARMRAVALRLEGLDGRWRCTALRVG